MAKIEASHDVQSFDLHAGDGELRPEANSGERGVGMRDAPGTCERKRDRLFLEMASAATLATPGV